MKDRDADIVLDLDIRNPGHFFACCGLLELAGRKWQGSEGWFETGRFLVATSSGRRDGLGALLNDLLLASPLVVITEDAEQYDAKVRPLVLLPLRMRLDWWLEPGSTRASVLKLWGGQQDAKKIFEGLQGACVDGPRGAHTVVPPMDGTLLRWRSSLTGRFGIDPGPAWDALDVGFSPNDQEMPVLTAPVTELLGAIGLQGSRPQPSPRRREFTYGVWSRPLPFRVARAAVSGALADRLFRFAVVDRGQSYRAFTYAEPIES